MLRYIQSSTMNERLLVVDDEKDICEILDFNLSNEGYTVDTALSAEEAMRKLTPEHSLILLDVMMGGMSGYKMAEKLRCKLAGKIDDEIIEQTAHEVMRNYDYNSYGGAYLLGCRKPVEKIHGAANERTIPYAVGLMRSMILSKMTEKISEQLDAMSRKVD